MRPDKTNRVQILLEASRQLRYEIPGTFIQNLSAVSKILANSQCVNRSGIYMMPWANILTGRKVKQTPKMAEPPTNGVKLAATVRYKAGGWTFPDAKFCCQTPTMVLSTGTSLTMSNGTHTHSSPASMALRVAASIMRLASKGPAMLALATASSILVSVISDRQTSAARLLNSSALMHLPSAFL